MDDGLLVTTCPSREEFDRAVVVLDRWGEPYGRLDPTPCLARVAVPALIVGPEVRARLTEARHHLIFAGWVPHRSPTVAMPQGPEPAVESACFRRAVIMVLQPCVADEARIRITAHVDGDLTPVLPYLNAVVPAACFTPASSTLTCNEAHRMVALYPGRITIAKADDIVDAWLALERLRALVATTWTNRAAIVPLYETRRRPPAIEIWRRLPGTNCGACGERTCLAFAARLWSGRARLGDCAPILLPDQAPRRAALLDICSALGIAAS